MTTARPDIPARTRVIIETARFGFVKRDDAGNVVFISPLPCPFNYGSVPGTRSADGERVDALVLGPRLPRGCVVERSVLGVVRFSDAGVEDPKWVCGEGALSRGDRIRVEAFFRLYARLKRGWNALHDRASPTEYLGLTDLR